MKAIGLYQYLPIENEQSLVDVEMDRPQPTGKDLLVNVRAISVNPVDTKVRAPKSDTETTPRILGWDAAGEVTAIGPGVEGYAVGDQVFYAGDITRSGSNSEYQLVDERIAGRMPTRLDYAAAAALPCEPRSSPRSSPRSCPPPAPLRPSRPAATPAHGPSAEGTGAPCLLCACARSRCLSACAGVDAAEGGVA